MPTIYDLQCGEVYTTDPSPSTAYDPSDSTGVTVGYVSAIAPRQIIITRLVKHLGMENRNQTSKWSFSRSMSSNSVSLRGMAGGVRRELVPLISQRTEEKRQLAELNDQFADYAGKVRYLEAVNRKLTRDLSHIQKKKGIGLQRVQEIMAREKREAEETVRQMDDDLRVGREKRHDAEQRLQHAEQRLVRVQRSDPMKNIKDRLTQWREEITALEKWIEVKRKAILDNDEELTCFDVELHHIRTDTGNLTSEIANESTQKQLLFAERSILEHELTALETAHHFDVEQLRARVAIANVDPAPFFESELASAVRDIRQHFELIKDQQRDQSQNYYQAKVSALIEYHQPKRAMESAWQTEKIREISRSRSDTHARITSLHLENRNVDQQIASVRQQIQSISYDDDQRWIDEQNLYQTEIERLKGYIYDLETYRTTLEGEINRYYFLLEGGGDQHVGLRHFANEAQSIMDRGRSLLAWLHLSHPIRQATHSNSYSSGTKHCYL